MKIPKEYNALMPYLVLEDVRGFLEFAKSVFKAEEQMIVPDEDPRKIRHGEIRIGEAVVMFAGATDTWKPQTAGLFLYVPDVDSVHADALKAGSKELMPPGKQDYGYTSGFEDPFGNSWWIALGEME